VRFGADPEWGGFAATAAQRVCPAMTVAAPRASARQAATARDDRESHAPTVRRALLRNESFRSRPIPSAPTALGRRVLLWGLRGRAQASDSPQELGIG